MNRIFFRFFVFVMLAITVATFVIYFAFSRLFGDPLEDIAFKQAAGQIFLLEQYIDKAPADEWLVRLNKVREISNIKLELIPLKNLSVPWPEKKKAALQQGELVIDVASKSFFRRVDLAGDRYIGSADDVIHVQDLPIDIGLALKMEVMRYVIVALFLLVPIGMWSRSHWNGLQVLSGVADAFGEGKLSTRAVIEKSASIYPLAQCMNHMAGRIETLLDAHKNLLQSVSHELRTPIARLQFGLELLRSAAKNDSLETRIQALEGDVIELDALVNELLSLTKLDQEPTGLQSPFSLADKLQDLLHNLAYLFLDKKITSHFSADLGEIRGDQRLIARAVGNLLKNAAKYANYHISLLAIRGVDNIIEIVVEDDGPGIPVAEYERIFQPFYRLDRSRDRTTGGFGLGLAIVQKAVSLQGGNIIVGESELGGAKFSMRFPAQARC